MSPGWALTGLIPGVLLIPALRGVIFSHAVPAGEPWRYDCPHCVHPIGLIGPSGKCPHCHVSLGAPPWTVELFAFAALGLLAWQVDGVLELAALSWLTIIGMALVLIDVAVHRLPDRLTFLAFGGTLLIFAFGSPQRLGRALLCALALSLLYLFLAVASPEGMGLGDAKFALVLGLVLGWYGWMPTLYGAALGFFLSGMVALILLLSRKVTLKQALPHGPFMLAGTLIVALSATYS
jgi:leader peptidase (prepilin peptidase)/N-methyltransferase